MQDLCFAATGVSPAWSRLCTYIHTCTHAHKHTSAASSCLIHPICIEYMDQHMILWWQSASSTWTNMWSYEKYGIIWVQCPMWCYAAILWHTHCDLITKSTQTRAAVHSSILHAYKSARLQHVRFIQAETVKLDEPEKVVPQTHHSKEVHKKPYDCAL